tara:strand:+ start:497 stop:727 length:231 start_codon:yes stop_codon:yes gene_type:complete
MKITKKDIVRPFAGLIGLQPVVIAYLYFMDSFTLSSYLSTGWGLQICITIYLVFFYSWYENLGYWSNDDIDALGKN